MTQLRLFPVRTSSVAVTHPCVAPLFRKFAPPSGAPVVVPALTVAWLSDEPASGIPPVPRRG